jgi:hypothetical protein
MIFKGLSDLQGCASFTQDTVRKRTAWKLETAPWENCSEKLGLLKY